MKEPTGSQPKRTRVRLTRAQAEWCRKYERETTFEALMDDFHAGNESFLEAAQKSNRWFEDWSTNAYLNVTRNIPGADE